MFFVVFIFFYFVENNVVLKERLVFIVLVFFWWEIVCDLSLCVRYEIFYIFWKIYESSRNGKGMFEGMD